MNHSIRLLAYAFVFAATTGVAACAPEDAAELGAPSTAATDDAGPEATGTSSSTNEDTDQATQAVTAVAVRCYAGEVGDERWMWISQCCTNSTQRQQLHRCDGRYWRPLAGRYRCATTRCAL